MRIGHGSKAINVAKNLNNVENAPKNSFNELDSNAQKSYVAAGGNALSYLYSSGCVNFKGKSLPQITKEYCVKIIDDVSKIDFQLPIDSKLKIKDAISDPEELALALKSLETPYDTAQIVEQRARNLALGRLYISNSRSLRKDSAIKPILDNMASEIEEVLANKKTDKPQFVAILGLPASGKSTYITQNRLTKEQGFLLIDSDEIKKMLPGYKEFGSNFTHAISSALSCAKLQAAIDKKVNIVYPTIGAGKHIIPRALQDGYEVKIIHIDTPKDVCAQRLATRFEHEGRFLDPNYLTQDKNPIQVAQELVEKYNLADIIHIKQ